MGDSTKIPLDEKLESIVKQCGPSLIYVLKSKFGCDAAIRGVSVDWGSDPAQQQSNKPKVVSGQRFITHLPRGTTVSVWKGDLTTHAADAVVNAANDRLDHAGGLALALSRAGGPDIQKESERYIKNHGKLQAGRAVVTTAGKLNYQKIIHAVGPCLSWKPTKQDVDQATPILKDAIKDILAIMKREKLKSVGIPAVSGGLFNFPLHVCADTIVKVLKEHDQTCSWPLEIHLVNHDEAAVREMERACKQFLLQTQSASYGSNSTAVSRGNSPCPMLNINNVSLTVFSGNIEENKTDVIVNTIGAELDLSKGAITRSILQAAGKGIQDEINKKYKYKRHNSNQTGSILETQGHNLNCRFVYHTICPENQYHIRYDKILADTVKRCLEMASKDHLKSISFPAIGTGVLKYDKDVVARVMIEAAVAFAQKNKKVNLNICYIIYPTDTDTYRAFVHHMRTHQGSPNYSSYQHSSPQALMQTSDHAKSQSETPHIELQGVDSDTMHEVKRWLWDGVGLQKNSFTVRNNFIQHFGQREHENLMSYQTLWNVLITESFQDGCARIQITGSSSFEVVGVGVDVEAMCCKAQEKFAEEEEKVLVHLLNRQFSYERNVISHSSFDTGSNFTDFKIVRIEKLENPCLKEVFEMKKQQLSAIPTRMYQRLPAHFCDMVSRVGFQRELAPPHEQRYGQGIYFSNTPKEAMNLWRNMPDETYLYFVEAQVLIGQSGCGSPDLILPPSLGSDASSLYDSVSNMSKTVHVIFNGHQALPEHLVICKKKQS